MNINYIIFYFKNVFLGLISLLGGIFGVRKELEISQYNNKDNIDYKNDIIDNKENRKYIRE